MKKDCFIKSVIIITIIVAVIVYIIQYKIDDWFVKPGKKYLVQQISENWDTKAEFLKNSSYKDSVGILLKYYLNNIESMGDIVNLDDDLFFAQFDVIIKDSIITDEELSKLTQILKKEENEKSTIDRN